jgi:hypothetical protein
MPSRRRTSASASPSGAGRARAGARRARRARPPRRAGAPPGPSRRRPARRRGRAGGAGRLHAGRLAVGPDAVELAQARDRRDDRVGAGGDDDVLGGVPRSRDLDDAWPGEPARAAQQIDAVVRQPALLAGVGVTGDHEVAPDQRRLDVDPSRGAGIARRLHRLARPQQRLRRDARPVGALAADQLGLDERDAQPALGQRPAQCSPGEPPADPDHLVAAHDGCSAPACSRSK